MIKLDANWKFIFWLIMISLAFLATKSIADNMGIEGGTGVIIYTGFFIFAILILFIMWLKFFYDNYLK